MRIVTTAVNVLQWAVLLAASALLIVAALRDIAVRQIPNWIALALVLLAIPLRLAGGDLLAGLTAGLSVFLVLIVLWRFGVLGGGDVKLWVATSLLIGPALVAQAAFSLRVVLAGGLVALVYLGMRRVARRARRRRLAVGEPAADPDRKGVIARLACIELWRAARGGSIPYAVAISAAGLISVWAPHG